MAQNDFGTIDPATTSGTQLASLLGLFRDAVNTNHSGTSRPAYAQAGMLWVQDISATLKQLNVFDGTDDISLGRYATDTNTWFPTPPSGVPVTVTDLTATEQVRFSGNISISVTGTIDNWAPTGLVDTFQINMTTSTSATITGIAGGVDGRLLLLISTTGGITLSHNNSNSSSTNRIQVSGGRDLILNRGDSVILRWEDTTDTWRTISMIRSQLLPQGYISGLEISNSAIDTEHDITLASGVCRSDDDTTDIIVPSDITNVPMDTAFNDLNGGGLRSGETLTPNTTVHMFVIDNPNLETTTPKLLGSVSLNPTLPANYSVKRRVGSVLINGLSNIRQFRQTGDYFYLSPHTIEVSSFSYGTAVNQTLTVPTGVQVRATIQVNIDASSFSIATALNVQETDTPNSVAPSSVGGATAITEANSFAASVIDAITRASVGDVLIRVSQNSANLRISIATLGWRDITR